MKALYVNNASNKLKNGAQLGIDPTTAKLKRSFDVIVSFTALIITLPILPFIALAIKLESKGDILFQQMRIGLATPEMTQIFYMFKFRTMRQDAEAKSGAVWAGKNDPRITRVGKFLRKTRLDEIPQLINVLKGEMSLIGPRPERPGFYKKLDNAIPYFAERTYYVKPGITGLAQVNQGYDTCLDDVRSKVGFDHSYAMALFNPISWLKMDCWIALKTILVMVLGRGQ
ncbi:sugar transferase [Catenovulum sp. SM1970]|uniref:sugar transferase n=1 Tax=Marinifaba aquimaris TaxID=2741323 RepID=UPI0015745E75|nr:sugar transferase [Marinifaba aquimaris]NTS76162.1 sugar transferase [Marinifaba aquimaris]